MTLKEEFENKKVALGQSIRIQCKTLQEYIIDGFLVRLNEAFLYNEFDEIQRYGFLNTDTWSLEFCEEDFEMYDVMDKAEF